MKVVLVANAAPPRFWAFVDVALSPTGITREDFPDEWSLERNLAMYENAGVEFWDKDKLMQRMTNFASENWGPWVLDETQYNIRVDRFRSPIFGYGVIAYFRRHDFLASQSEKKKPGGLTFGGYQGVSVHLKKLLQNIGRATAAEVDAFRGEMTNKGQSMSKRNLSELLDSVDSLGIYIYGIYTSFGIMNWTVKVEGHVISVFGNHGNFITLDALEEVTPPSWTLMVGSDGMVYAATNTRYSILGLD
jgi:hypothetical protein